MDSPTPPDVAAVTAVREIALAAGAAAALRLSLIHMNTDPDTLRRLLWLLTCHGVFEDAGDDRYRHTPSSRLLREDAPRSLRYMVLWATEPWTWAVWPRLDEAVRNGKGVFTDTFGKEFFTYLHEDAPESAGVFDRAMTQSSALSARAIAAVLDLSGARRVADIAGGQGLLLATLLDHNPHLDGVLFDLPDGGSLAGRCRLAPGDCRVSVDVDADVFILKNILEWDDESTVTALRNVAGSARPGDRVVVIENLVDGSPEMRFTTAMDLLLLLNVDGKKHTRAGLTALVERAGLRVERVAPVGPYLHLIDSRVAG